MPNDWLLVDFGSSTGNAGFAEVCDCILGSWTLIGDDVVSLLGAED